MLARIVRREPGHGRVTTGIGLDRGRSRGFCVGSSLTSVDRGIRHAQTPFCAVRSTSGGAAGAPMKQRLWYIGHTAYDLTEWLARHPGGRDALLQAEGSDCTELFRTYHLKGAPTAALLARYAVEADPNDPRQVASLLGAHFTFAEGGFYQTMRERVRAYFRESGLPTEASRRVQVASVVVVLVAIALNYPAFVLGSVWAALGLGLLKGLAAAGPGHSMSHFSVFRRGRWNTLVFRLASPFLVSNPAIWSAAHIQSHHIHTLTATDLQDHYPVKRVQPALAHRPWHRGQHVYAWLIYMFGLPLWAVQDLTRSVGSLFTGLHAGVRFSLAQRIENTVVIAVNIAFSVALPFFFLPAGRALVVCLVTNVVASLFVTIQISVNHEVPETQGHVSEDVPIDWGVHQVLTSHNYAVGSAAALHLSGGLNMQIEHHLFPGVHYTHYPAISRLVRATCDEFGLPYHRSRSIWEAMAKHYEVLRLNSVP